MRSKFILCGTVKGSDKVSDFRLVHNVRHYCLGECVRVNIPDDMHISTYPRDGWSICHDNRTLDNVGWDCYIVYKGEWRKFNWLKCLEPHEWHYALKYIFGLYNCYDDICFTDDQEYYNKWYKERQCGLKEFIPDNEVTYPKFNKNAKELNLPYNLKEYMFNKPDIQYEWHKIYKNIKTATKEKQSISN